MAMSVGDRGHYLKGSARVAARINNHIVVQGGFGFLDMSVSRGGDRFGVNSHGPIISVEFRDR